MASDKIFSCPDCGANIPVGDPQNTDLVTCNRCSCACRLEYVDREQAWELIPVEPVEKGPEEPTESNPARPFEVFKEPAGLRKDDTDKL